MVLQADTEGESPASVVPPPPPPPLTWVRPPQQARSHKTLARLLDAAEELIAEKGSTALSVSDIVRHAGSSVGAFYARFSDKDALLSTLHERSCSEALATAELALDPARWEHTELGRSVGEIVRFTARLCRERQGLVIAFMGLAATDAALADRRCKLEAAIGGVLCRLLRARASELSHPDLEVASAVSIRLILSSLEYGAIIHRSAKDPVVDADRMAHELTQAVLGYLGVRSVPRAPRKARAGEA